MKRKLNIGIFTIMLSETNGTAEATRRLVIGLARAGHDVHVFSPTNGVSTEKGVIFHKAGGFRMSRKPEFHFALPLTRYFFNRHGYYKDLEVVHAVTPMTMGWLAMDIAKLYGIPKIITHHSPLKYYSGDYFPVIGKLFALYAWTYERFIYNRFHAIHVPTLSKKGLIVKHKLKEPIFALTNGILDKFFQTSKNARSEVCEYYKIPEDKKILLYAGRQGPEKNVESKVRALRRIRDQNIDAHLILAGGGPQIPYLKSYAEELGVADHVTQTDWIKYEWLRKIYNAADVSTLYNNIEAQGLVLLEAMAQGTPCVGKNATGISDVIVNGKTGYLASNEEEFADKIKKLLLDDDLREQMGKNALDHVIKNHKMSNIVPIWERIYKFIIDHVMPMHAYHVPEPEIVEEWREFIAREPLVYM
ncbi:MAG: glycosyltransferase [Candidatus Hodarchaeota archaeon]